MADYYTQVSMFLLYPAENLKWMQKLIGRCIWAEEFVNNGCEHTKKSLEKVYAAAVTTRHAGAPQGSPWDELDDICLSFMVDGLNLYSGMDVIYEENDVDLHCPALWVHGDEATNIDLLASCIQEMFKKFKLKDKIGFEWASSCSKPRLDAFGGGAVVVSAKRIKYMNTGVWLSKQLEKRKAK